MSAKLGLCITLAFLLWVGWLDFAHASGPATCMRWLHESYGMGFRTDEWEQDITSYWACSTLYPRLMAEQRNRDEWREFFRKWHDEEKIFYD